MSTFGLIATFGGIGVVVNVIVVYIVVQVRGEHLQNEEYRQERQRRFGSGALRGRPAPLSRSLGVGLPQSSAAVSPTRTDPARRTEHSSTLQASRSVVGGRARGNRRDPA